MVFPFQFLKKVLFLSAPTIDQITLLQRWQQRSVRGRALLLVLEMATAPCTRQRAVVGAPRRAAWQLKSVLCHSVGAAPRTIIF